MKSHISSGAVFAAHEDAAAFYRRELMTPTSAGPRQYLAARGFSELLQAQTVWTVGYAPAAWTATYDHLSDVGYSDDVLLSAGLVIRTRHDTLVDRFRDRITFGVRDADGRLCGFTARRAPGASTHSPKYLNSPTTPIYDKGALCFGLSEARQLDPRPQTTVLAEGPLDAIAFALGATLSLPVTTLALCGSRLTAAQASAVIGSPGQCIVLALDGDAAGRTALFSVYKELTRHEVSPRVARSNLGDPAEVLAAQGPLGVQQLLTVTVPALETVIDDLVDHWPTRGSGAEADLCALRSAVSHLMDLDSLDYAAAARRLADKVSFPFSTVSREMADALSRRSSAVSPPASTTHPSTSRSSVTAPSPKLP